MCADGSCSSALTGTEGVSDDELWGVGAPAPLKGKGAPTPGDGMKTALEPANKLVERMRTFASADTIEETDAAMVAAAKTDFLSGVYVAAAEEESAAAGAMLKWAYTVCHAVEAAAAGIEAAASAAEREE